MMGMAIRKSFGLPTWAGRTRVGRGGFALRGRERRSGRAMLADARGLLTAVWLFAFVLGSVACNPAAHRWLDLDAPTNAQAIAETTISVGGHETPAKGNAAGLCTGHCLSHSVTLPAELIATAAPYPRQAIWPLAPDQRGQASTPSRLERPPRV